MKNEPIEIQKSEPFTKGETMKTVTELKALEITTDLNTDTQNVIVNSVEELEKFCKFAGGQSNVYAWTIFNDWQTVGEWCQSNDISDLF